MKKIYSLLLVFAVLPLSAQVTVDNFENTTNNWVPVSCGAAIVENPAAEGLNKSCTCLQMTRVPGCDNWSGAMFTLPSPLAGYKYVHALMLRNNGNKPNVKVTDNGENLDIEPMNTIVAYEWQDVVFDISDKAQVDFIFFMADRENITEDAVMYVDDIILSNDATPRTTANKACGEIGDYELVWNMDFAGSSLPACWNIETNGDGGGNNELQYYCEKGVSMGVEPTSGKHCLILTATKENYMGKGCTSGRVNTLGKLYYTFGKIEARIKFPKTANGLWPAFWQMGNNYSEVGWPRCGETDIIELGHQNAFQAGTQDRYFNGAMHVGAKWDAVWSEANSVTWPYAVEGDFHIITMIWTPTSIDMYMDKDAHPELNAYFHQTLEPNDNPDYDRSIVFGKPNFLIANLAVGGDFPGIYDVNQISALAGGSRSMYIDWIRIYQRGEQGESFLSNVPSEVIEEDLSTVDNLQADAPAATKMLRDGQLLIKRGDTLYDIQGNTIR